MTPHPLSGVLTCHKNISGHSASIKWDSREPRVCIDKSAHGRLHPVLIRPIIAQIAFVENGGGEQRMRLEPDIFVGS